MRTQHAIEMDDERVQEHHVALEETRVQLRALGDCVEQLAGVVEEFAQALPPDAAPTTSQRLELIRWTLRRIW